MSVPAQGPITLYAPKPVSVRMFPPADRHSNFRSKFKLVFSVLLTLGVGAGFYSFADEVRGVIAQGGSAVTLEQVLDESFNLSLAGYLEGTRLKSTATSGSPLTVASNGLVANLNADLLDGQTGSYYTDLFDAPADTSGWVDEGTVVRLRTATDRVGIGTASPEFSLHVSKTDNAGSQTSLKAGFFELNLNANDADPFNSRYAAVQGRSRYYGSDGAGDPDIGHVRGLLGTASNFGTGTLYAAAGVQGQAFVFSSGDITEASGVTGSAGIDTGGSGTVDRAIAFYTPGIQNPSTGTINSAYGLLVGNLDGGGTVTDNYGIFIENSFCSGCTNSWALYSQAGDNYFGGDVGIGTDSPGATLDVKGATSDISAFALYARNSADDAILTVRNDGLVGIGTDSPDVQSLTVDGGLRVRNDVDDIYRSDFAVDSSGLFITPYDDDLAVFLAAYVDALSVGLRVEGDNDKSIFLDNSGAVGIGTATPDQGQLEVKGGTVCVDTNGDDDATECMASESDARLKTNIAPIEGALDKLLSIRGVEFDWRWNDP